MVRDVELADPEREIDRVEIFEGRGEVRKVKGEEDDGESGRERKAREARREKLFHAGRMNSPSFRLPIR